MRIIRATSFVIGLLAFCTASERDGAKKHVGAWQAEFKGIPYVMVSLKPDKSAIGIGSLTMNEDGYLTDVRPATKVHPIRQAVLKILNAPPSAGPFAMRRAEPGRL